MHFVALLLMSALPQPDADSLCGPRCVAFAIEYYTASRMNLTEAVDMIPGWSATSGCSLQDIVAALVGRGLKCTYIPLASSIRVKSGELLVCCRRLNHSGHFVVVVSGDDESVRVWDGSDGISEISNRSIQTEFFPIGLSVAVDQGSTGTSHASLSGRHMCGAIMIVTGLCSLLFYRKRV